jgi:hypothetical protein
MGCQLLFGVLMLLLFLLLASLLFSLCQHHFHKSVVLSSLRVCRFGSGFGSI